MTVGAQKQKHFLWMQVIDNLIICKLLEKQIFDDKIAGFMFLGVLSGMKGRDTTQRTTVCCMVKIYCMTIYILTGFSPQAFGAQQEGHGRQVQAYPHCEPETANTTFRSYRRVE